MVANGKSENSLLNKFLKDYNSLIFGKQLKNKPRKSDKDELFENLKGYRALFGKEKVTFKPKIGRKIQKDFNNVSLEELMKMEK